VLPGTRDVDGIKVLRDEFKIIDRGEGRQVAPLSRSILACRVSHNPS